MRSMVLTFIRIKVITKCEWFMIAKFLIQLFWWYYRFTKQKGILHVVPFLDLDLVFEIEQHELTLLCDLIWDSHNVFMCKLLQYHLITCEKHVAYLYEVEIWSFITSKNYNASLQLENNKCKYESLITFHFLRFHLSYNVFYLSVFRLS